MTLFTGSRYIAAIGVACVLGATASFGQQVGTPQPYPQTGAYSQPAPAAPYPTTQTPAQQTLSANVPPSAGAAQQTEAQMQQPAATQSGPQAQQPIVPQVPKEFQLNQLQEAALDQVLDAWQKSSSNIATFSVDFERLEYVPAFGPVINNQQAPLNKNKGELSYAKPDKGSFQIKEISTYKVQPAPANQPNAPQQGDWVKQQDAIGEHWVCDGKSVYEFRSDQKQVIERPLPPEAQGQAIIDGPLPFLFGADRDKLKKRYFMRIDDVRSTDQDVWIIAQPKFQEQAANFSRVEVILNRAKLLPKAMRVTLPNGDQHVYIFQIDKAIINNAFARIQQALFQKPATPWGWKHVVENPPQAQAERPTQKQAR